MTILETKENQIPVASSLVGTDYLRAVKDPTGGSPQSVNVPLGSMVIHWRNLILNGDMQIAQRGTSFTGMTGSTTHTLDRWLPFFSALGTWTVTKETDAPAGSGLTSSIKLLVTTADGVPSAADAAMLRTKMEGQFLQNIRKGTSGALQLSLSFWVKSNVTGNYVVELVDVDNNRHVASLFNISASATWQYKTVTFPADASGAITNDNTEGIQLNFWLAAGNNWTSGTLPAVWAAVVNANRAVGQTNLAGTINNYIQFTGVQLEAGPTSTEFEFLPFDMALARCKRYYQKSFLYATAPAQNAGTNTGESSAVVVAAGAVTSRIFIELPVPMRTAIITVTTYNPSAANNLIRDITGALDFGSVSTTQMTESRFYFFGTGNAGSAVNNRIGVHWAAEAEL